MTKNRLEAWLLIFLVLVLSCSREGGSTLPGLTDDTDKAVKLVESANEDLKEIKKIYKANESGVEDLKLAMKDQKIDEVKKIANNGVYAINDGMALGAKAVEKIDTAQRLNIDKEFKKYLGLKATSLRKFMDAFEIRRQLALSLRNGYDPADDKQRESITAEFKTQDEKFKALMDEASEASQQANELFKRVMQSEN